MRVVKAKLRVVKAKTRVMKGKLRGPNKGWNKSLTNSLLTIFRCVPASQ